MLHVWPREEVLHQVQRRRVEPLQVVEEEREWMLWPGECVDESTKDQMEPRLRVARRKFWYRRLLSDNHLQLRHQTDHQLSIRIQRLMKDMTPLAQLLFGLAQKWPYEALKCLGQRRIRDIALVLIKFSGCEQA